MAKKLHPNELNVFTYRERQAKMGRTRKEYYVTKVEDLKIKTLLKKERGEEDSK